jgi:hypothetical protein
MLTAVAGRAQDATVSDRMVQAFLDYCINTDPIRILAKAPEALGKWGPPTLVQMADGAIHDRYTLSWRVRGDPHSQLSLQILRINGVPRACTVGAVWPEKSEIIRALAASVVLGEVTSTPDVERSSEIIRWVTHAHGSSAVVELRVPTYIDEPGRSLTLLLGR